MYRAFKQICPGCKLERSQTSHLYTIKEMKTCVRKRIKTKVTLDAQQRRETINKVKAQAVQAQVFRIPTPPVKRLAVTFPTNRNGLIFKNGSGKLMLSYMKEYNGPKEESSGCKRSP